MIVETHRGAEGERRGSRSTQKEGKLISVSCFAILHAYYFCII